MINFSLAGLRNLGYEDPIVIYGYEEDHLIFLESMEPT